MAAVFRPASPSRFCPIFGQQLGFGVGLFPASEGFAPGQFPSLPPPPAHMAQSRKTAGLGASMAEESEGQDTGAEAAASGVETPPPCMVAHPLKTGAGLVVRPHLEATASFPAASVLSLEVRISGAALLNGAPGVCRLFYKARADRKVLPWY